MNQSTHAWLAVEAYRKIENESANDQSLVGLCELMGAHLGDVVVASWLPDSLIKDMTYGHVFKNSRYKGQDKTRYTVSHKELSKALPDGAQMPLVAFPAKTDSWWSEPYRVKTNGGHLPARVIAIFQGVRDMLKMGDDEVLSLSGVTQKPGAKEIATAFLYSPRDIALEMWMLSHYVADGHMPFHSDNRALGSTSKGPAHGETEDLWGANVPQFFKKSRLLRSAKEQILAAEYPANSQLAGIDFGKDIPDLKSGDPWLQAVNICRAGFAASFALVPADIAPVDSQKVLSLDEIMTGCASFWEISRAIMHDAVNAIAMFWVASWREFTKKAEE